MNRHSEIPRSSLRRREFRADELCPVGAIELDSYDPLALATALDKALVDPRNEAETPVEQQRANEAEIPIAVERATTKETPVDEQRAITQETPKLLERTRRLPSPTNPCTLIP